MKCERCGKDFAPKSIRNRYCSKQCQTEAAHAEWRTLGIMKPCEHCGRDFEARDNREKYCSEGCRKKAAMESVKQSKARQRAKKLTGKQVARKPKTLDDWCREAAECNLDYGTYRALITSGKTFEELKALAGSRGVQIHAHGRVHKAG